MEAHLLNKNNMFYTKVGTVFVRLRGEKTPDDFYSDNISCKVSCESRVADICDCRYYKRTRWSCQISDCDSEITRCRPYKTKKLWRRYVNVFAAICILLLVEGLFPQTSAAPQRLIQRKMDRTKRWTLEENHLWSNPCDYKNVDKVPVVEYKPKIAENIAALASNERYNAESYRHEFAQVLHSYSRFEELLPIWDNTEWLRKFPWFEDRVLPAAKKFGHPMPQEYISALMKNIDEVLPVQYKAVKMIVAAFHNITRESLNEHVASYLKSKMTQSMHSVRAILCAFNELLQSRKLPILKIDATEIPTFGSDNNSAVTMLLVYRDMLNMMHYLAQEFEAMSKMT